jgi:hypothetical protein
VTDDRAGSVVGEAARIAQAGGGSCPAWCTEQVRHSRPGSHVHRSASRQVAVTAHWWCHDVQGSGADLRCTSDDGIVAFLTMADDDGVIEVVLQHGDMELPHVSLQAADELAINLLQLVRAAR